MVEYDLGMVKGPKGDKGDTGAQGPAGPIGPKGDKGDIGPQGPQGPVGLKGDAFTYDDFTPEQLASLKGPKGDKGDTGSQGLKGDKGDTGAQGPAGLKGDKGDTGSQGPQGPKGDAFTFEDFTPEQLANLKGPKGDTGAQGEKGDTGPQGPKGDKGDTGLQGPKGDKGDTGPAGPKGDTGDIGPQGPQGDKGEKGDKGDPGTITIDTSLSTTSTNAVQNKAITTAINSKADTNHTHNISDVTNLQTALDGKANTSHTHSAATLETDGFLSMQDKAKLDNLSYDSGWQEVTFKPGYAGHSDSRSVYVRRKGDLVELTGVWKPTSTKSASSKPVPFASIPNELKPTKPVNTVCFGQGKNTYMLTVNTDADVCWSRYGTNTSIGLETNHFGSVYCMWTI